MEEIEVPTEHLHEQIHEHIEEDHGESPKRWVLGVALSTSLLAVLAAIAALLAGHHANEAMIEQIRASDRWSYYQAESIKINLLTTKNEILVALGRKADEKTTEKVLEYKKEQESLKQEAQEKETEAQNHLQRHNLVAQSVTMFQVAIAIAAISVLTKRKYFWWGSLAFGGVGLFFFIQALQP